MDLIINLGDLGDIVTPSISKQDAEHWRGMEPYKAPHPQNHALAESSSVAEMCTLYALAGI